MSNQPRELIIGYFSDTPSAETAAARLVEWHQAEASSPAGGMGILSMTDDGRIATRRVGTAVPAWQATTETVLNGLHGGAPAGNDAPAGSPLHARLGLSDAAKSKLEYHLGNGGSALALLTNSAEAATLVDLLQTEEDQRTQTTISAETMSQFAARLHGDPLPARSGDPVPIDAEAEPLNPQVHRLIETVRSLKQADAETLVEHGITTANSLLEAGSTVKGRRHLAAATGISTAAILKWVNDLDLARIRGIGVKYSDLLEHAGVDTVPELAQRNPENLHQKLIEVNEMLKLVIELPSQKHVENWVEQAKELPRVITY